MSLRINENLSIGDKRTYLTGTVTWIASIFLNFMSHAVSNTKDILQEQATQHALIDVGVFSTRGIYCPANGRLTVTVNSHKRQEMCERWHQLITDRKQLDHCSLNNQQEYVRRQVKLSKSSWGSSSCLLMWRPTLLSFFPVSILLAIVCSVLLSDRVALSQQIFSTICNPLLASFYVWSTCRVYFRIFPLNIPLSHPPS